MKYILTFLFLINANAANFRLLGDIGIGKETKAFSTARGCVKFYSKPCIDTGINYNPNTHKIADEMVEDFKSPIWATRSLVMTCAGKADCQAKALAKKCVNGRKPYYDKAFTEVWCNKITGYNKKPSGRKIVVEDAAKKAAYMAQKALEKSQEDAIDTRLKDMKFGQKLYAIVQVMNVKKGLTRPQRKLMRQNLKAIRDDLMDGDICSVRSEVAALVADGVLIKASDIAAILAKIDSYKTCK